MSEPTDDDKKKELSSAGSLEDLLRQIIHGGALSVPSTGCLSPDTNSSQEEHLVPKEDT